MKTGFNQSIIINQILVYSYHMQKLCRSLLICRQTCLFWPQALSEHPSAQ